MSNSLTKSMDFYFCSFVTNNTVFRQNGKNRLPGKRHTFLSIVIGYIISFHFIMRKKIGFKNRFFFVCVYYYVRSRTIELHSDSYCWKIMVVWCPVTKQQIVYFDNDEQRMKVSDKLYIFVICNLISLLYKRRRSFFYE